MNVKQGWPKIVAIVLMCLSLIGTILTFFFGTDFYLEAAGVDVSEDVARIVYLIFGIIGVAVSYIPTLIYSSPKVFIINAVGNFCCCIGWFVALYYAIKDKSIPTMAVGVPTDYSQNQVNNYWGNDGQAQNQWGNNQQPTQTQWDANNQQPAQTQWDNTQPTQNQWDANNQQPTQNSADNYWNQNGNSQGF